MADNFSAKDSTGTAQTIAYLEVGGVKYRKAILYSSGGTELVGETTSALSLPVVLPSDMQLLGRQVSRSATSFTRPANTTAYASGDLVANHTTAGSVTPMTFANVCRIGGASAIIRSARLRKSTTTTTNADFRLHLYDASPTVTNGDNGAFLSVGAAATPTWLGYFEFANASAYVFSDGVACNGRAATIIEGLYCDLTGSNTSLYGLVEARAAYAPGNAEVFHFTLDVEST